MQPMSPQGLISANRKQRPMNWARSLHEIPGKHEPAPVELVHVREVSLQLGPAPSLPLCYTSREQNLWVLSLYLDMMFLWVITAITDQTLGSWGSESFQDFTFKMLFFFLPQSVVIGGKRDLSHAVALYSLVELIILVTDIWTAITRKKTMDLVKF